jgi:hypothetical protein
VQGHALHVLEAKDREGGGGNREPTWDASVLLWLLCGERLLAVLRSCGWRAELMSLRLDWERPPFCGTSSPRRSFPDARHDSARLPGRVCQGVQWYRPQIPSLSLAILALISSLASQSKETLPAELKSVQQRTAKLNSLYSQNGSSLPTYEQRRCQDVCPFQGPH